MNAHDKAEALRLLDEMGDAALAMNPPPPLWARHSDARKALRSLLSAQGESEPSAEHWRQAIKDDNLSVFLGKGSRANWIEQRARELARKGVGNG